MTEAASAALEKGFVELGRVLRPHGVGGAFIVSAYTENPATILKSTGLELRSPDGRGRRTADGLTGRLTSGGLIVKIPGLTRREEAAALKGWRLVISRALLPPLPDDEVYWADLLGLSVSTRDGRALGRVENLMEAGAGLLLVVIDPAGLESLIPFQPDFVDNLDLAGGRLVINPPPGLLD
jgi:16S rRNA processing protein RimM